MNFLQNELVWVRKPKQSVITENAVEIITEPVRICGKEPITDFKMTMRRFCK